MINLILLTPLIFSAILFLNKNKPWYNIILSLSAVIQLVLSIFICCDITVLNKFELFNMFGSTKIDKIFLMILSIIYLAFVIYNLGYMKWDKSSTKRLRNYAFMVLMFIFSMTGAILSANLGLTWVFLEGATLASAYLIYFYKTKHSIEAAWKYVFICSIGIALAFVGIILLTVATGKFNSLNYTELYLNAKFFNPFWLKMSFVFILFGIGTKMGLAPLHFWLPDAYSQAPAPVSALISATLTNSAFLMILKVFRILELAHCDNYARIMMFVMGFLSLFIAAVFVYHINNFKRMLAYSSIENMGILIIGAALGSIGLFASLIHLIGHSFIKAGFFMTGGNISKLYGTKKIKSITGIISKDTKTGWLWVLSFLAISAFPPSILFISEFLIVRTMLVKKYYIISLIFLFLLTIILYGIGRAAITMAFGNKKEDEIDNEKQIRNLPWLMYFPQIVLIIGTFTLGLYMPKGFIDFVLTAIRTFN